MCIMGNSNSVCVDTHRRPINVENENNCIELVELFEVNNFVKTNVDIYRYWLKFVQIIPFGKNYDVTIYTDCSYCRNREPLRMSSKYQSFYKNKLPIYEHLKIENPDSDNKLCLSDEQMCFYNTIKKGLKVFK